jgi:transcriptional regulator with PAS, ATPase and Fis domain
MEGKREEVMDMQTRGYLDHLADLCEKISMKKTAGEEEDLFEYTKTSKYPGIVARMAEAFGMMMVSKDADEYYIEQVSEGLRKARGDFAAARERFNSEDLAFWKEHGERVRHSVGILGKSRQIRDIVRRIERVADLASTILITGETGTGKELIGKAIHLSGKRREMPFVAINCAAVPESIFESEIFGIEKGVATGVGKRIGKLELASGGTIFFDEIGDMPLTIQAKVLRVIEDRRIERLGSERSIPVDIRIVAATNKDLKREVMEERFREDLFYRLNVIRIHIPPLRERREDIPILVDRFIEDCRRMFPWKGKKFSEAVIDLFMRYPWPGNVRELRNEVERAMALVNSGTVTVDDLSEDLKTFSVETLRIPASQEREKGEGDFIARVLRESGGNKSKAARLLGMSREGLRKKINRLINSGELSENDIGQPERSWSGNP